MKIKINKRSYIKMGKHIREVLVTLPYILSTRLDLKAVRFSTLITVNTERFYKRFPFSALDTTLA